MFSCPEHILEKGEEGVLQGSTLFTASKWQCPSSNKEGNRRTINISLSSAVSLLRKAKISEGKTVPYPTSADLEGSGPLLDITIIYVMNTLMSYQEKRLKTLYLENVLW